jgi:hypothetical protein
VHRLTMLPVVILMIAAPVAAQSSLPERIIEEDIKVALPPAPCAVPAVASRIARAIEEPAGIEYWPGSCQVKPRRPEDNVEWLTLRGLSAREALNKLIELDPRYRWSETEGVIVVRPLAAWTDPDHFLHRTVASFSVHDLHLGGALHTVINAIGPFQIPVDFVEQFARRTPQADRPLSVDLGATSIIDALSAVVRAHGASAWIVGYCLPRALYEDAGFDLRTYDGAGVGGAQHGRSHQRSGEKVQSLLGPETAVSRELKTIESFAPPASLA